ncbi:CGNR zinc finger domain-containing protein [Dietzia kunjamensis]|uniref:CGNR zinc finger domain-containing protein n=1 Tax=Dietzia kunjamensis TaxID=322509 RepID=UPI002DBC9F41|nr:CGNR zinc finger domain-containing protein [Dietzia kunjamensis]MEB8326667.1 CGNR zinc finger domain-containing protein [Dietzia kunjamensis]
MQFNHDNMIGPLLAVELASLAGRGWDTQAAAAALHKFEVRDPALSRAQSHQLLEWSHRLREPFEAGDVESTCAAINCLLEAATSRAFLSTHDGMKPHLHFTADHDDAVARAKAITAGGLAIFAVESAGGRLGACTRHGCPEVFVDTSRNGRRAYCSARCGNYEAVRRHRAGT